MKRVDRLFIVRVSREPGRTARARASLHDVALDQHVNFAAIDDLVDFIRLRLIAIEHVEESTTSESP